MSLADAPPMAFLASTDLDRTRAFFCGRLGLTALEDTPFALVLNAAGTQIRIARVESFTPQPFTVLGWLVPDATDHDLEPVLFEGMGQDAHGIWSAPNGDRVLWFQDPDGNLLSLSSPGIS